MYIFLVLVYILQDERQTGLFPKTDINCHIQLSSPQYMIRTLSKDLNSQASPSPFNIFLEHGKLYSKRIRSTIYYSIIIWQKSVSELIAQYLNMNFFV